jgi:hypothetical protein
MAGNRTIITLPEEDKQWLESYSRAHHISMAEAIRRGIRKLKDVEREGTYRMHVRNSSGIWKSGDGLTYQEKIRSDWHFQ